MAYSSDEEEYDYNSYEEEEDQQERTRNRTDRDYGDMLMNLYYDLLTYCEKQGLPLLENCRYHHLLDLVEDHNSVGYVFN